MIISDTERPATRIRAASRAVGVLIEVSRHAGGVGVSEVAHALGLAVPTTHHLLRTLCDEGVLVQARDRRYELGPRIALLVDAFLRDGPPDYLMAPLVELAREAQETVYLTGRRGSEIHTLHSIEGAGAVRVAGAERGRYRSPHARATGKLMLAFSSPTVREHLLGDEDLQRFTEHTIVDRAVLDAELAEIRERGWSEDHEEFREGVACIAVPALIDDVVLAAYTVACPVERFKSRREELLEAARAAAAAAASHPDVTEVP